MQILFNKIYNITKVENSGSKGPRFQFSKKETTLIYKIIEELHCSDSDAGSFTGNTLVKCSLEWLII